MGRPGPVGYIGGGNKGTGGRGVQGGGGMELVQIGSRDRFFFYHVGTLDKNLDLEVRHQFHSDFKLLSLSRKISK